MTAKSKRQQMIDMAVLAPLDWIDERTAAVTGTKWFLFRNVPRDVSWSQTLGSAALTAFIVQTLTRGGLPAGYERPPARGGAGAARLPRAAAHRRDPRDVLRAVGRDQSRHGQARRLLDHRVDHE